MTLRFTLTPRLLTIGAIALLGLLTLLFLLGVELGRQLAATAALPGAANATARALAADPLPNRPTQWRDERPALTSPASPASPTSPASLSSLPSVAPTPGAAAPLPAASLAR